MYTTKNKQTFRSRIRRFALNLFPAYRGTGARCIFLSPDFREIQIKLPLKLRTRNYVGTIFGGSMFGAVDPIYMLQLINVLGSEYVVWDKAATIRFKRPANKTLYARFLITDSLLAEIKEEVKQKNEIDKILKVNLEDKDKKIYAEVEKLIYIANKTFYKNKKKMKAQ